MGTSNSASGPSSNTPLVPTWLEEAYQERPEQEKPEQGDSSERPEIQPSPIPERFRTARTNSNIKDCPSLSCAALLLTLFIGLFPIGCFAMMACFFIYIPINNSIEDTPSQVYAIYQGIVVILTALLAYIVVVKPRSLSITKAVEEALKKIKHRKNKDGWNDMSNEERLAEVLTNAVDRYVSG